MMPKNSEWKFPSIGVRNCLQLSFIAEKLSSTEYTMEVRVASPVQEEVVHHLRRHHLHLEGNLYDQQRDTYSITDVAKYIYVPNYKTVEAVSWTTTW